MIRLLLIALATLFTNNLIIIPVSAVSSEAKVLLASDVNSNDETTFKLNPDVLEEISQLQGPIRVIAVIGNARVGKSTTLNLISHILSGRSENSLPEIFKTGDTSEPVTRDVWAHIIQPPLETESFLLLDVEGTDLGDDGVTDHLSMFTAMMSSDLNVFASDTVKNSDVTFLYRISVLSEIVFPGMSLENFPKLRVVIRGDLKTPKGSNFRDLTRNAILEAKDKGKVIKNYFPRDNIAVRQIPFVKDLGELFENFENLRSSTLHEKTDLQR